MKRIIALFLMTMVLITGCGLSGIAMAEDAATTEKILMPIGWVDENGLYGNMEYDQFGNLSRYVSKIGFRESETLLKINYFENGAPMGMTNPYGDTYNLEYDEAGNTVRVTGRMELKEIPFYELVYSEKEGCAYQLTKSSDGITVVEQYSEDYRLLEQLYYKEDNATEPYQRRYYAYNEAGQLIEWKKSYDGRYDVTDTFTSADYDEAGHCMLFYGILGINGVYDEYTEHWECTIEKDASGRIIKDVHTSPDSKFNFTYEYAYEGDEISEMIYTAVDTQRDDTMTFTYNPVEVTCDELQKAMIMLYSQDAYANFFTEGYYLNVNWELWRL